MLDWENPAWLAALIAIALVWWLHRRAPQAIPAVVSAAFLWEKARAQADKQVTRAPADRIWWLRAALVACIVLALAKPLLISPQSPDIHVWLDDSLSMATVESGQSRHATATRLLLERLRQSQPNSVTFHALSQPLSSLTLTDSAASWPIAIADFGRPNEQALRLPDPVTLPVNQVHWLVTDGADTSLPQWAQQAPLAAIIQVGGPGDDIALTQLSVRRTPHVLGNWQGIVSLTSAASKPWQVPLTVRIADVTLVDTTIELQPGVDMVHRFDLPSSAIGGNLLAQITPNDGLAENNTLQLATEDLRPTDVSISGECSPYIHAALKSHPGLSFVAAPTEARLAVVCGEIDATTSAAVLQFHVTSVVPPDSKQPLQWHRAGQSLVALDLEPIRFANSQIGEKPGVPLLSTGKNTLISFEESSRRKIHIWFDIHSKPLAATPQFPLLISGLISFVLGRTQLDAVVSSRHSREEALIQPKPLTTPALAAQHSGTKGRDVSTWLITLALALLLADAAWTFRRDRRRV